VSMEATLRPRLRIRPRSQSAEHAPLPRLAALLALAPLAIGAEMAHQPLLAFPLSVLALAGGAFLLGEAAEVVATRLGEAVGALLTATLSNTVTLAILGAALVEGLYDVVHASIVGAILGNILFALGAAMLAGGLGRAKQSFGREAAAVNSTLLLVASFAFLVPALVGKLVGDRDPAIALKLTVPIAVILLATYVVGLLFSTRTHRHLYDATPGGGTHKAHPLMERYPVPILVASVAVVALLAEVLANSLGPVGDRAGIPPLFLGIVVIGLVANSVEIATALRMARRDRMNVALQVATGSGIQVMLFVTPLLVFASLALGRPLSMEFPMVMALLVGMASVLVNVVASDGESTWYEGVLLLALYAIVGLVFLVLPV
jgi:Ca2+:H+ antiporter